MPFGFGATKTKPISEAKRLMWKRQAETKLHLAVKAYCEGDQVNAERSFEEALKLERDSNA